MSIRLPGEWHVRAQGRNGYTALDLYDGKDLVRTLTAGTKREVYTYLKGMEEAQYLERDYRTPA